MIVSVTHSNRAGQRVHEAVVNIRGVDRPFGVQHPDDDEGTRLVAAAVSLAAREVASYEINGEWFETDPHLWESP